MLRHQTSPDLCKQAEALQLDVQPVMLMLLIDHTGPNIMQNQEVVSIFTHALSISTFNPSFPRVSKREYFVILLPSL